jgi:hypothetical protein
LSAPRGVKREEPLVGAAVENDHPGPKRAAKEDELVRLERPEDVQAEAEMVAEEEV